MKPSEAIVLVACVALYAAMFYGFVLLASFERPVRYDCSMAEFHPDYPQEVKRQCREMRKAGPFT